MNEYCVAVADASRARLFVLEGTEFPELESGPRLVELKCLMNPEKELPQRKVFASTKSGRNRAPSGGTYTYDDHRLRHELDFARRFANKVVTESVHLAHTHQARCLILVADSRMLGLLRAEMSSVAKNTLKIREYDKEMTKLASPDIHDHLARQKLLPPCRKPGGR